MSGSMKLDVIVRHEGEALKTRTSCPVRKRPDGTAGIVINGLVYGLGPDHSVDLSDEGLTKEECPEFFMEGEELWYLEADPPYVIETTSRGTYLAFDGDRDFASDLQSALEKLGLSKGLYPSFRRASNGHFYDYYIRITPGSDPISVISKFFASNSASVADPDPEDDAVNELLIRAHEFGGARQLLAFIGNAELKIDATETLAQIWLEDLQQAEAQVESLRIQLGEAKAECRSLDAKISSLETQVQTAKEHDGLTSSTEVENMRAALEAEAERLAQAQQRATEAESFWELEKEDLKNRLSYAEADAKKLRAEVENIKAESRPFQATLQFKTDRQAKHMLSDILSNIFPRLEFEGSDYEQMLQHYRTLADVFKVMERLQAGENLPCTGLNGFPGVKEIRNIRTGIKDKANMGRIYFRKHSHSDTLEVAIHVKEDDIEQQRFLRARFG